MPASMKAVFEALQNPPESELSDQIDTTDTPDQKGNPLNIQTFGRYEVWEAGIFGKTYYSVWSEERTDISYNKRHNDKPLTLDAALALARRLHREDSRSLILEPKAPVAKPIAKKRKRSVQAA